MTTRTPAVSGTHYPSLPARLRADVKRYLGDPPAAGPRRARGLVAPHGRQPFAGATIGAAFGAVEVPDTVVVIGPNHGGRATAPHGGSILTSKWYRTPLGDVPLDDALAERIVRGAGELLADDEVAHSEDHAVEAVLPFLQVRHPDVRVVPILLGWGDWERTQQLARAIADALAAPEHAGALVVASTNLTHFLPAEETKDRDSLILERLLALDGAGLLELTRGDDGPMCGRAAAACACEVVKRQGGGACDVVGYSHSGLATGDESRVVGYAAVRLGLV